MNQRGMGILFILAIILAMGLAAGVGSITAKWAMDDRGIIETREKMARIATAISRTSRGGVYAKVEGRGFMQDVGSMPTALSELLTKPVAAAACSYDTTLKRNTGWCGPYWVDKFTGEASWADSWGVTIAYSATAGTLTSYGPDKLSGGGDDLILPIYAFDVGLTAYYKMEEATGIRNDSSGNGHGMNPINSPTNTTGVLGNAVSLSVASTQYLNRPSHSDFNFGNTDFTILAWVNLASKTATAEHIFSKYTGTQRAWMLYYNGSALDKFSFLVNATGAAADVARQASTFGSPSISTWYFVAGWHDSVNNTLNIQVNNGAVDSSAHATGSFGSSTADVAIGGTVGNGTFNGSLDGVGAWNRLLTTAERTFLYNGGAGVEYPF